MHVMRHCHFGLYTGSQAPSFVSAVSKIQEQGNLYRVQPPQSHVPIPSKTEKSGTSFVSFPRYAEKDVNRLSAVLSFFKNLKDSFPSLSKLRIISLSKTEKSGTSFVSFPRYAEKDGNRLSAVLSFFKNLKDSFPSLSKLRIVSLSNQRKKEQAQPVVSDQSKKEQARPVVSDQSKKEQARPVVSEKVYPILQELAESCLSAYSYPYLLFDDTTTM